MQTDDINGIGTRIKEQRRKLSLTLSDMSAYTGLSNGHLSNIERNQTSPTLANLKRICEALGMSVSDMIKAAPGERTVVRKNDMFTREYRDGKEIMKVIDFGFDRDRYEYVTLYPDAESGERKQAPLRRDRNRPLRQPGSNHRRRAPRAPRKRLHLYPRQNPPLHRKRRLRDQRKLLALPKIRKVKINT